MKIRRAWIANLARSNDVVERVECLFHRGLVIEQMFLVEINVVGAESLQAIEFFITLYI
jgi:UDP-N-acetylglucosamine enolpyruvyl transferase